MKVSVKQIKMIGPLTKLPGALGGCARQWVGSYLDRLVPDFKPEPLVVGIAFHKACEHLVKHGALPPGVSPEDHIGKMARSAVSIRPVGRMPWRTETVEYFPWRTNTGTDCMVHLRCDLRRRGGFVDYKSTSDRRYALTSLAEDIQARVYAGGVMLLDGVPEADADWIYVSKRDYSSWRVPHIFQLDDTLSWLHREIDGAIDLIAMLREHPTTMEQWARQLDACEGVGKFCDVKGPCFQRPDPAQPLITIDQLKQYKQAASVPQ